MVIMRRGVWLLSFFLLLSACTQDGTEVIVTLPVEETVVAAATLTPIPSPPPATPATPLPPTPTARPLPPVQATGTPDPALLDWTLLFYLPADSAYAPSPLALLNEMSNALPGGRVQILAQLDSHPSNTPDGFADARRYRLQPGQPELLTSLGEINMADGSQLTDFLTWGLQTAPANHVALIIVGPGGGWRGLGLDETTPDDRLTLPELETALAQSRQTTGLDQVDLLLLDAPLMAQVDLLTAVQAHTGVVVAPAGMSAHLDYARMLPLLAPETIPDAAAFATALISSLQLGQSPGASWVAVDMAQVPPLTQAVELLAEAFLTDPSAYAPIASAARRNATAYAWLSPQVAEPIAALDAWHFASLVSQLSDDASLIAAATNLMSAIRQAVLAEQHGPAFLWSRGIALTFPRNVTFLGDDYASQTAIPAWAEWLSTYYQTEQRNVIPPALTLGEPGVTAINRQNPLFLGVEIAGLDLEQVNLISGRYDRTGRRQLLEFTPYVPRPQSLNDGSYLYNWADGLNETLLVWPAELPYLADGRRGDWVLAWPIGFFSAKAITGQVVPVGQESGVPAHIIWDQASGTMLGYWLVQSGLAYPMMGGADLLFRPDNWYMEFQGQMTSLPGRELNLAELNVALQPLADGGYFVGIAAANGPGDHQQLTTDVQVVTSELFPNYQVHVDPGFGFHFLYPTGWLRPTLDGQICQTEALTLCTFSADQRSSLHVIFYPDAGPRNATMLRDEALAAFSGVDVLYQVEQTMAAQETQYTVYGYTAPDGDHVGVLLTFVRDGVGYVLDLDGPAETQVQTLDFADKLLRSWQFQPLLTESFAGQWTELVTDQFALSYPVTFSYTEQANGWYQWDAGLGTFMAVRLDAAANRSADTILRTWLASTSNKTNFQAVAPYQQLLGQYAWQRSDFSWTSADGSQVSGFIMVTVIGDQALVAWAEAPTVYYLHAERATFRIILADLTVTPP